MKPSLPKGMRDFSPAEMMRRNEIFSIIRKVYEKFGFRQIETPSMEMLATLTGKYGDEGDKLIFKVLNSGNYLSAFSDDEQLIEAKNKGEKHFTQHISEKALRYDLTVPFARYVVMHQNEITFPFRRYQIQPVWRADRPQKGRYREFYQCDADVIGSTSLLNEVELIQIIDEVFFELGLPVTIKVNNRKLLMGLMEVIEAPERFGEVITIIDKLDKIGEEKVLDEIRALGINERNIEKLKDAFALTNKDNDLNLGQLDSLLTGSETAKKGIDEVKTVLRHFGGYDWVKSQSYHPLFEIRNHLQLDLSLARGLDYYTGMIFEVKMNDAKSAFTGSLLGGGRYDDLAGNFGLNGVSGVGISFGIDRIYDVMEECGIFSKIKLKHSGTKVLFINFGGNEEKLSMKELHQVRAKGINAELYPDHAKIKKQMTYADSNEIPFVAIIGSEEAAANTVTIKNMRTGEQVNIHSEEITSYLQNESGKLQ